MLYYSHGKGLAKAETITSTTQTGGQIMWCPKCKAEYRDGIAVCAECNTPLVESLPIEVDISPAQAKIASLNRMESRENLQALSDGNKAYVEKSTKYEDMKATAYSFLLVGAAGIVLLALSYAGIIPLQFAAYMKSIMGIVMGGMFLLFFIIGIRSYLQLGGLKAQVQEESQDIAAAKDWFFSNYSAKAVDVSTELDEEDGLQQKYFKRSLFMKQKLQGQFPDYGDPFLDYLTEQFYEELFPQD